MHFPRLLSVEPRSHYRLYLRFDDGAEGELDLSPNVMREGGVFARLSSETEFATARISQSGRAIEWDGDIDISAGSAYLDITHQSYEQWAVSQSSPLISPSVHA
jgi:Protein of unknown function (DUF2442)